MQKLWVGFATSTLAETRAAVAAAVRDAQAQLEGHSPGLVFVTATVEHDAGALFIALRQALPGVPVHGITTSLGVLSKDGIVASGAGAVGVLLFAGDDSVGFAVGHAVLGDDARAAGRVAAQRLASGPLPPRVILFNSSPGREEDTLRGIADVLPGVPAFGGSAADHAIAGEWSVFTNDGVQRDAVSLAALCGDVAFAGALRAPYAETAERAQVTAATDRRLQSLDGQPAGAVLNRWLDDSLALQLAEGGNILAQTALRPLALRHQVGASTHYLTIHPAQLHAADGSVDLFARIATGDQLCLMSGSVDGLIGVLGDLHAQTRAQLAPEKTRAAILIYCAGCAGAVGPALDQGVRMCLGPLLGSVPLLGLCTFGEQGHVPGLGNVHQDLSVSLLLLGEP